jgi:hypothetical protein
MKFAATLLIGTISAEKLNTANESLKAGTLVACDLTKEAPCADKFLCMVSSEGTFMDVETTPKAIDLDIVPTVAVCQPTKSDDATVAEALDYTISMT